ncbi:hypothetical protein HU200_033296 [Digitaria exilis]|uniref:F-box domain-containing protein n=1 Tax=Digitaria exilis TaxID=1010633 RepID=A0A835BMT1_9POAL|nr:hypothetical protein HU200_033296 [Digitaria exilis]
MESRRNTRVAATATSHGVLPLDLVFDVLLRLSAKEICRLRTVCRPWRSLTSDPAFIKLIVELGGDPTASPELHFPRDDMHSGVVVGGAVYYFVVDSYDRFEMKDLESDSALDLINSFDFETEHWSTIRVPNLEDEDNGNHDDVGKGAKFHEYIDMWAKSVLAELKGYLVLAHNNRRYSSSLDLWFLTNMENSLWVKEYSIKDPGPAIPVHEEFVKPLLLLEDGRIVFFIIFFEGTLAMYDPMTKVFSVMKTGVREVALYTGSLLAECSLSIQSIDAGV